MVYGHPRNKDGSILFERGPVGSKELEEELVGRLRNRNWPEDKIREAVARWRGEVLQVGADEV